ncbi:MAG: hypothetical protein OEM83_08270 [Gammaproteobacteria bacterium]|nr:hypothetical protein [Gammaproteobacteria bacterium]
MTTTLKPVLSRWYRHLDKGQQFFVAAIDDAEGTIEIQHFDGDVEEMDFDDWRELAIEPIETPEDWTGPMDDIERDDLGYTETGMTSEDWAEPLGEQGESTEISAEEERGEEEEEEKEKEE